MRIASTAPLAVSLLASVAHAQDLLVVDALHDVVMLVSGVDGSVLNPAYIDLKTSTGSTPKSPLEAIEVGGEIWVSDSLADVMFVFDASGNYLGEHGVGRDKLRGIALANGSVWAMNAGLGGSGYSYALKEYDTAGNLRNVYSIGAETDPFDVLPWNGELLVSDVNGDDIDRYDYAGNYLGIFYDGGGSGQLHFPEQLAIRASNGNILAAGSSNPSGIYEFDPTGALVAFYDTNAHGQYGVQGVHELQNGNLLFTNPVGLYVWDVQTNIVSTIQTGVSPQYITELSGGIGDTYCDVSDGSTNNIATIRVSSSSLSSGITVDLAGGPPNQSCYLLIGNGNAVLSLPPGSKGDLCVAGGGCLGRYSKDIGSISAGGMFSTGLESSASGGANYGIPSCGGNITAGQTWYFQYWHRQPQGQPSTFSQAIGVTFTN